MRGTPQTHLLAFSFLCLLSKVRGPWAPKHTAGFLGVMGEVRNHCQEPLEGSLQALLCWAQPGYPSLVPRQLPLTSSAM